MDIRFDSYCTDAVVIDFFCYLTIACLLRTAWSSNRTPAYLLSVSLSVCMSACLSVCLLSFFLHLPLLLLDSLGG